MDDVDDRAYAGPEGPWTFSGALEGGRAAAIEQKGQCGGGGDGCGGISGGLGYGGGGNGVGIGIGH
jgi:hypothetical protein